MKKWVLSLRSAPNCIAGRQTVAVKRRPPPRNGRRQRSEASLSQSKHGLQRFSAVVPKTSTNHQLQPPFAL